MSKVVKQSGPTTRYGRQIVYDRELFISICRRLLEKEDLREICAKPPMPIGEVFLGWMQDHPEARAIYRSVQNFECDRELAKELRVPWDARVNEWEDQVRANCERGWRADWVERKYIPPDWSKVYPLVGGPPVWSTENIEAYNELLNDFTQMLEPRDMMELMSTKEAADASWEVARIAREKNGLPERKCQQRLKVLAELERRRTRAAETTAAKPATALDHSLGLEAGFKYYQALDIAQSRAIKRRDNALRQIARWRDGLGAKARALSDKFIAEQALEQALAERYDAVHLLADAETDNNADEAMEAAPQLAPVGDAADIAPAVPTSEETAADIAPAVPPSAETAADIALAVRSSEGTAGIASAVPSSEDTAADIAPAVPPSEETAADFAPAVPPADEGAEAAPPRAPADDEPINWVGWLTGAERYTWLALSKGAHKDFKQPSTSKKWLVQNLVVDRKVIRPDQLCPELAQHPSCAHSRRLRGGPEMSSQKQIEANLRNAQKSKGPRTAAGKARASRNSRKHALSTISHNNPLFAQRIEAIAREICPETTNSALREQALIIGECTTVLVCVQDERIALIEQSLGSTSAHMTDADAAGRAELGASQCKPAPARDELKAMGLAARDLNRLERYERRALSRRKRAIETFMAINHMP